MKVSPSNEADVELVPPPLEKAAKGKSFKDKSMQSMRDVTGHLVSQAFVPLVIILSYVIFLLLQASTYSMYHSFLGRA